MSKKRALKVFVAMAFGRGDTDALYDKALKPLLTRPGDLRPVRVDRSDRNEPIDEQIYKSMRVSDFAVADLTYARPSVYYEAGWMRGNGKPVIFTCRADHLERGKPPEVADRLRVHFDLEQESIVVWKTTSDRQFQKRLKARLRIVLEPLLKRRGEEAHRREEETRFAQLSASKRCELLAKMGESCMRAARLRRVKRNGPILIGVRGSGQTASSLRLIAKEAFTRKDLDEFYNWDWMLRMRFDQLALDVRCAEWVFVSLRTVRRSTMESVFRHFDVDADGTTFTQPLRRGGRTEIHVVHVLGNIKSERELRERLTVKLHGRDADKGV